MHPPPPRPGALMHFPPLSGASVVASSPCEPSPPASLSPKPPLPFDPQPAWRTTATKSEKERPTAVRFMRASCHETLQPHSNDRLPAHDVARLERWRARPRDHR